MAEKRRFSKQTPIKPAKKSRIADGESSSNALPPSDIYRKPWQALGAWFLGPRGENREKLKEFTNFIIDEYCDHRANFFPADPCYITEKVKHSRAYIREMEDTRNKLDDMNQKLTDSIPFFSTRYQGHMTWETTMPSTLGYFLGMLWNQNNVDSSASPVTTQFEINVGQQLCELMAFDGQNSPWAHITGCGSIANLEAMWSARNMKFHPLAMQAVCSSNPDLSAGGDCPIFVPELNKEVALKDCTTWQLLNLDVDEICSLTDKVNQYISGGTAPDDDLKEQIDKELANHSVVNIGMHEFCKRHEIGTDSGIKNPVVLSPGTNHYSWPKSATVLGLGDQAILPIHVDKNARLDIEYLQELLNKCKLEKIPVIMVVAVIGSTEESAVDPISEVYDVRSNFRTEGVNFAIHADAAWGGYLLTMLKPPSTKRVQICLDRGEDFVPNIPLSEYAEYQYRNIGKADTVTIDPHKAGLCQYPAGALCYRNGTMKGFITLAAPEVFHGENDVNVGVYGLEGSKPGAAACGVLLSHEVIGLDQMGYGRILGQCQLGAKLFYCMWMTAAQPYDDFECLNMIDLPPIPAELIYPAKDPKEYIRNHILGKDNRELFKDKQAMEFLKTVGPDALINSFVVNPSGNTNIDLCNKLQKKLFDVMNATVGQSPKRIPIFLTTSTLEPSKYGEAVYQLKRRLGFEEGSDDPLGFLRQTAINPFQASEDYVTVFSELFRNACLNCIASMGEEGLPGADEPLNHYFVVVSDVDDEGRVFLDYSPSYAQLGSRYHVVVRMKIQSNIESFRKQRSLNSPMFLRTKSSMIMYNLLHDYVVNNTENKVLQFDAFKDKIDGRSITDLFVSMQVEEVFRYNRLESLKAGESISYPEHAKYFMYGDNKNAYLSHVITKHKDFHQVVKLDEIPHSVPYDLLDYGLIITIPDINGNPIIYNGGINDPLQCQTYTVEFRGKQYAKCKTTIALSNPDAKIWFDSQRLNDVPQPRAQQSRYAPQKKR